MTMYFFFNSSFRRHLTFALNGFGVDNIYVNYDFKSICYGTANIVFFMCRVYIWFFNQVREVLFREKRLP